ncbi:MAG: TonB-dependent receptor, partial [Gemmatimonadaceae bacterium]
GLVVVCSLLGLQATTACSAGAQSAPTASLRGTVYDSVAAKPMAGATIQLVLANAPEASRSVRTDSLGGFRVDSLPAGEWLVGLMGARLDSLGVEQLAQRVTLRDKRTARVTLAIPSARTLITRICGDSVARDSSGLLHGVLRRASPERPGIQGTVRVQWVDYTLTRGTMTRSLSGLEFTTAPTGEYRLCGVPTGAMVRLRAWSGTDSTGILDVELNPTGLAYQDLTVGSARRQAMPLSGRERDSAAVAAATAAKIPAEEALLPESVPVLRGTGRIEARLRGPAGQPVPNARVTVWGSGLSTISGADGRVRLAELPTGSYLLDVRALGYEPHRRIVDLLPDSTVAVAVGMEKLMLLDTVRVRALRAQAMGPDIQEFSQRRKQGMGRFLGPEELERINPIFIADVFRMIPSVRVQTGGMGGDQIFMRGGGLTNVCAPDIYVDRARIFTEGGLDSFVPPSQIRAVEVYTSNFVPPEYNTMSGCGVIVIWTGSRK